MSEALMPEITDSFPVNNLREAQAEVWKLINAEENTATAHFIWYEYDQNDKHYCDIIGYSRHPTMAYEEKGALAWHEGWRTNVGTIMHHVHDRRKVDQFHGYFMVDAREAEFDRDKLTLLQAFNVARQAYVDNPLQAADFQWLANNDFFQRIGIIAKANSPVLYVAKNYTRSILKRLSPQVAKVLTVTDNPAELMQKFFPQFP